MQSRRNNTRPNFVLPQHFPGSGEWNGTSQVQYTPQTHSTTPGLGHLTSYNVANLEQSHGMHGGGYLAQGSHGTVVRVYLSTTRPRSLVQPMSNRAAIAPYQHMPPAPTQQSSILTTSPVELSLPSHQETELWLRNHLKIPAPQPLNLWCLRDITSVKKLPNLTEMIFLAIWGSPYRRLGLSEIYTAIEDRYPILKTNGEKAWQRSIRHRLSLKACFVRVRRDRRGADWMIDVSKGLENSRAYKASPLQNTSGSSSDSHNHSEEDATAPFMGYSSDSDAFLTPPPEISTAIQEYTFMSSGGSIHDLTEQNIGKNYDQLSY
ncbi:hypothetical protein D9619_003828 [Psilocybe cf. subviscida]|uniref:Fork-head domain-containing protein n=1 Tax=Psilocybe cf. subviscida TaxID=2480587 RepID=A0A8H5AX47_9AGAR|nr:hypothetical protein D9619_003828 [Psilocybe cf. subviscida]